MLQVIPRDRQFNWLCAIILITILIQLPSLQHFKRKRHIVWRCLASVRPARHTS